MPSLTQTGKGRVSPQAQEHAGDPYPPTPELQKPSHSNSAGDASPHFDSRQPCAGPASQPHWGAALHPHASLRARPPVSPGVGRPTAQSPCPAAQSPCPPGWAVPQLRARVPRAQSLCPPGWAVPQLRAFLGAHRPPQPAQELMCSHPSGSSAERPGPRLTEAAMSVSTGERTTVSPLPLPIPEPTTTPLKLTQVGRGPSPADTERAGPWPRRHRAWG